MGKENLKSEENLNKGGPRLIRNIAKAKSPQLHNLRSLKKVRGIPTFEELLKVEGKAGNSTEASLTLRFTP